MIKTIEVLKQPPAKQKRKQDYTKLRDEKMKRNSNDTLFQGTPLILIDLFLQSDPYLEEREQMVRLQIEARGVHNEAVLGAMRKVPRHLFVPEAYQYLAYNDQPLPIGKSQTISQPYMVACMTDMICPQPGDKVLEIGTGSGYQAAVLSGIVTEVYTVELIEELAERAKNIFDELQLTNIHVKCDDGYDGWPEVAPFDAIIVTAAATSVPQPLLYQLKDEGTMVIPVGWEGDVQYLRVIKKRYDKFLSKDAGAVRFVPFVHKKTN